MPTHKSATPISLSRRPHRSLSARRRQPRRRGRPPAATATGGRHPQHHTGILLPFLKSPAVVASKKDYDKLPYLAAASKTRPAYTAGDKVFVRGLGDAKPGTRYSIVRLGAPLHRLADPHPLGYAVVNLGTAELLRGGSEAEIRIDNARREIDLGDRLIPLEPTPTPHYFPSAPNQAVAAQIVATDGNVLEIAKSARMTKNTITGKNFPLPPNTIGYLMVFRVFPKVSYAVITAAKRGIPLGANIYYPVAGPAQLRSEAQLTP